MERVHRAHIEFLNPCISGREWENILAGKPLYSFVSSGGGDEPQGWVAVLAAEYQPESIEGSIDMRRALQWLPFFYYHIIIPIIIIFSNVPGIMLWPWLVHISVPLLSLHIHQLLRMSNRRHFTVRYYLILQWHTENSPDHISSCFAFASRLPF